MFRKGRQPSSQFSQTRPEPVQTGPTTPEPIKEERMVNRDRSAPISSGGAGTVLGADVEFKGSLKFGDDLRINGKFEGELTSAGTVHVGPQGDVQAEISVGNAVVEGTVNGNITASDRIELRSTAQMMGDLRSSKLIVEEGVVFVGRCEVRPESVQVPKPEPKKTREPVPEKEETEVQLGLGA